MRTWSPAIILAAAALVVSACSGGNSGPTGPSGPPSILDVNGATAPSGPTGSTVLIEGSNFGATQGSALVLFSNGTGGTVTASIASAADWSDQFIITTVPAGAASGDVVVQTSKGTSNAIVFSITQSQAFSPSAISWTATTSLPAGRRGLALTQAVLSGANTIYAIGGEDSAGAPVTTVYSSAVGASGTLGAWTTATALPRATEFMGAVVATRANSRITGTGYIYVVGGDTGSTAAPTATVYQATLASDGSISSWTAVAALPQPLHSAGVALFHGDLYVFGGSTTGDTPVATAYRSRIDDLGNLGTWQTLASLPFKRSYFGYGQFGGYLYAFGGDSGTVAPNTATSPSTTSTSRIAYARIDLKSGNLTSAGWTVDPAALTKADSKQTAVIAGGNVLNTAGLYSGAMTGSSEESYAQLNADGSTGSFNGATGLNTINAAGGGNLFNHAATGYVDGNGAFHVLVVGGDDVNTPGTAHKKVFYY